jgi:hypothetical protein
MIGGLQVAVECEECGIDESVFEDECGRWVCQFCQFIVPPCEEAA